jgi:hypothetical protein
MANRVALEDGLDAEQHAIAELLASSEIAEITRTLLHRMRTRNEEGKGANGRRIRSIDTSILLGTAVFHRCPQRS